MRKLEKLAEGVNKFNLNEEERKTTKEDNKKRASITTIKSIKDISETSSSLYTIEKVIGKGTFGVVYQAVLNETKEKVAIKKVFQDKRYKNRELQIIKDLKHPNIVGLLNSYYTTEGHKLEDVYLNLVMEYLPETLSKLVRSHAKQKTRLNPTLIKIYAYQMFRALVYLSAQGIAHRDIKPQNILVDPLTCALKFCDFGSAKKLVKGEPNISYICSRYYRAPELIFGCVDYTTDIDTWSIGCVLAEMFLGEPLFAGDSAVDQLVEIIKILGTPTLEQVKKMNPDNKDFKFPQIKPSPWGKIFKGNVDPLAIDLLSKVLVYAPMERLKPLQALAHPYFNELRGQSIKSTLEFIPDLFNFTKDELSNIPAAEVPLLLEKLVPKWYTESKNGKK